MSLPSSRTIKYFKIMSQCNLPDLCSCHSCGFYCPPSPICSVITCLCAFELLWICAATHKWILDWRINTLAYNMRQRILWRVICTGFMIWGYQWQLDICLNQPEIVTSLDLDTRLYGTFARFPFILKNSDKVGMHMKCMTSANHN